MSDIDIETKVAARIAMAQASLGIPLDNTSNAARILAMAVAAGGSENIDGATLVEGSTPQLTPAAKAKLTA